MARPEKNTVEYFPFICDDGKKMFYIEETYGNDGFATFIKILRELAKTNNHFLDLSKNTTTMFLSAKCKVSKNVLEAIINDLVDLEKFDRVLWSENRIIWCQDFIDSIQDAYNKRKNNCITYEGLLQLLCALGIRKPSKLPSKGVNNTQTILEDTILKNNIKKEEEEEDKPTSPTSIFSVDECFEKYKADSKIIKAVCDNPKNKIKISEIENRLKEFNHYLIENGETTKEFKDYCSHFRSWHLFDSKKEIAKKQKERVQL